ncbi:hypothetical protein N7463_002804 [Penicillium fimorum]|uniref:DUF7730 domain-containing protein n=1 Tax=Penicillium fimorum TaxID=1882269 RepID=A0A9W9XZV3_9EURO|nr:hypothetical protein N7463_002804 [Penicillium fimorum]
MPMHLQTPASGHSLPHSRRINISNLKRHQLVADGGHRFQHGATENLPSAKHSLLYSNLCPPKSTFSSGNTISVVECCIFFDQASANGNDPTNKLWAFYAASLAISVHAVIIAGDRLLVALWGTALHQLTTGHTTTRTPSGDLTREELILCYFYNLVEDYSEAIDIVFQKNTFLFNHTDTFIEFTHTLLPQRTSMIRNLQLSFLDPGGPTWNRCCQVLATMLPGLKNLTIHLYPHVTNRLDDWLIPLHQIQQATVFDVLLIKPWYLDLQWEKSIGLVYAPFQFVGGDVERREY